MTYKDCTNPAIEEPKTNQTNQTPALTLRLLSRVASTSWGPMALAMYPKVLTVALRMAFLWAFRSSSSSKQMRIHSLADTYSAPLSAMRPTRSIQFS